MAPGLSESDGPEDVWAAAHQQELIGSRGDDAASMVTAAGFRPAFIRPADGRASALIKVPGTVTLISFDGVVRRVRR